MPATSATAMITATIIPRLFGSRYVETGVMGVVGGIAVGGAIDVVVGVGVATTVPVGLGEAEAGCRVVNVILAPAALPFVPPSATARK